MPTTLPAFDMRVSPSSRSQPVHRLSSFLRFTVRWKLAPHAVLPGEKFTVLNGISISAVQPMLVRRTRAIQMPSHDLFMPPPKPPQRPPPPVGPVMRPSPMAPDGLISKK